jgi:hypothetical protein
MSVVLDRRAWRLAPGMPFRISHPAKGIINLVMRAGEVNDGTLLDGKITVKAVQDVFGMPDTSFVAPVQSGWTPPDFTAIAPDETRLYEVNWRDYYLRSSAADRDAIDEGTSYVALLAKDPPGVLTQGYDVLTKPDGGTYTTYGTVGFTNWLELGVDPIGPLDTTFTVANQNVANFVVEYEPGMVVMIDDEQLELTSFDQTTLLATVKRGVADTIPASHDPGATIWLIDDEIGSDNEEYQDGELVFGKALTRTSTAVLNEDEAVEVAVEVNQRVFRPYPPANVKLDGDTVYEITGLHPEPVLTWAHRNRLTQADIPVGHEEPSVALEDGVEYRIRVYSYAGTVLLSTHDVGTVDTWTYSLALQSADGNPGSVQFELESVRSEIASQFLYRFKVVLRLGWGYNWGLNWGGM